MTTRNLIPLVGLSIVPCLIPLHCDAAMVAQELFDGAALDQTITGQGAALTTSQGFATGSTWLANGPNGLWTANNFNVNGSTLPGLPSNNGSQGGAYWAKWAVGNNWNTGIYATRELATTIDFGVSQTLYFSIRLNNAGDTAMGMGLASAANGSASFVGAGFTWDNATSIGGSGNNAANAAYIGHGTLNTNNGVYGIRANEAPGSVNGYGLLVGRITINATGNDLIEIKRYAPNAVIDHDLGAIVWSASSTLDSSMVASHLVIWANGGGNGELDAVRIGTTWTDVTGVTLIENTNYSYWDTDGDTAGAGGTAPAGNWADANWSTNAAGDVATTAWTAGKAAVFAAGSGATDAYSVTLADTQSAASVKVEEGDVELVGGGTLSLEADGSLVAAPGAFLTVSSAFTATDFSTSGNVFLNGSNTVTGSVTINSNTLTVASALSVGGLAGSGNLEIGANPLSISNATDFSYSGRISGAGGSVAKHGAGILSFTGTGSVYDGGTTIHEGTIATANFATLGSGPINIETTGTYALGTTGTNQPAFANAVTGPGAFNISGSGGNQSFWSGDFSGFSGTMNNGGGWWARSSANTGSTAMKMNLNNANLGLYDNESAITRTFHVGELTGTAASRVFGEPGTGNAITLSVGELGTSTGFAGTIQNNWSGNTTSTMGLTKVGGGTLTLSGANTYTGTTTVLDGVLAVGGNSIANAGKLVIDGGKVQPTGTETVDTLFFGTTQQVSGTWGATGSGAEHEDDLHFSGIDGVVDVTTGPGLYYSTWIAGFPGAAGAPGFAQDPDNDGISNGVEQVLGTDPSQNSAGLTQVSATANSVTFRHTQTNVPATDVAKSYEWSTDLVEWKPSGDANTGGTAGTIVATIVTDNAAPDNDIIEVVVTATGTPTLKLFVRLVATQ